MKKANLLAYTFVVGLLKIIATCKGQRYMRKAKIKGPAITLSNHTSFYDFLYTTAALFPQRINYLAAKKFFYEKPLGPLLRAAKAIPKALLEADAVATKEALKVVRNNGILSIFPEGQISITGVLLTPSFSIAKLIKKAAVPLYIVKHYNAYLVNPPWNNITYKGPIITDSYLLFSAEQIKLKSEQEIYEALVHELSHNPFSYNKEKQYKYKEKPLTNLDYILYECPACHTEGLTINHRTLLCPACKHTLTLDKYWQFGDTNIYDLYEKQRASIKAKYLSDDGYFLRADVTLESFRNTEIKTVGHGTLSLDKNGYVYQGTIDEKDTLLTFDPRLIPSLPSDTGKNVQIYENGQLYQFVFTNPKLPVKFILLGEIIHSLLNN